MKKDWKKLRKIIKKFIKDSRRPDYITHAESTERWLLELDPKANEEQKLAAFAHDFERCFFTRIEDVDYGDAKEPYLQYKKRHAQRCADMVSCLMMGLEFPMESIKEVNHIILHHKEGGDYKTDLMRDADSLSYMENNLPGYYEKNGEDRTIEKVKFMYSRASNSTQKMIRDLEFVPHLKSIIEKAIG